MKKITFRNLLDYMDSRGFFNKMSDEQYLKLMFRLKMHKKLNLADPKTFNEKLQWLKLYNRNPEYTKMVDKYEVKKYISEKIGEEYIIPTLGVWDSFEEIDFDKLPNQFVLKCTHDSGGLVVCKDKRNLDIQYAKRKINTSLKRNYYLLGREWPYKDVKKRIIAEKFISKKDGNVPEDYKIFIFNGKPGLIQVDLDRFKNHRKKIFLPNWQELNFDFNYPTDRLVKLPKPDKLEDMLILAKKIVPNCPFIRTDFYIVDGHIYFGELTFFPASGFGSFSPIEWDKKIGDKIIISK